MIVDAASIDGHHVHNTNAPVAFFDQPPPHATEIRYRVRPPADRGPKTGGAGSRPIGVHAQQVVCPRIYTSRYVVFTRVSWRICEEVKYLGHRQDASGYARRARLEGQTESRVNRLLISFDPLVVIFPRV